MSNESRTSEDTHRLVQKAYGDVAKRQSGCCQTPCCCGSAAKSVPDGDLGLSCGNPVTFSQLRSGDVVLDLGCGAGRDVFLAAREVGPTGRVIGVDMTPEMLVLARRNAERLKLENVEFRSGAIERLPLEEAAVDVVISNCVINLSPDKPQVFREAYRVLRPGGRLIVSDIVLDKPLPENLRNNADLYTACVAGALPRSGYLQAIQTAGFQEIAILAEKGHAPGQAKSDPITSATAESLQGVAASITVFAKKRLSA